MDTDAMVVWRHHLQDIAMWASSAWKDAPETTAVISETIASCLTIVTSLPTVCPLFCVRPKKVFVLPGVLKAVMTRLTILPKESEDQFSAYIWYKNTSHWIFLVHGSHIEQRIFAGTKWLGRYQVQASRFIAQVIVLVIINAMISNDWKIGIMKDSKKSQ